MLAPFEWCVNFILPEPASYVFFYAVFNLRKLLYIICYPALRLYRLSKSPRGIDVVSLTLGNSPGHVGKVGVVVLPLLVLIVLGGAQMLQHAGEDVHRVSAVDLDVLAGEGLQ